MRRMQTEIEAKFPGVDPDDIRAKLKALGATLVHPEVLMRRKNFDYPDERLDKINGWIRVRDEGDKVTMSYKQLMDRTLHGTKEVSVIVNDFDTTCHFLDSIGLESKAYQETKREKWMLDENEVTIDTWPWVPSFVEIEGPSEESVRSAAKALEFDWNQAMHGSVETVYQMHYNVTEFEVGHWERISFIDTPEWLKVKSKHNNQ